MRPSACAIEFQTARRGYARVETIYCTSDRPLAHTLQEGRAPPHHASQAGKEAVVAALLEAKADVNSTDKVQRTRLGRIDVDAAPLIDRSKGDAFWIGNLKAHVKRHAENGTVACRSMAQH